MTLQGLKVLVERALDSFAVKALQRGLGAPDSKGMGKVFVQGSGSAMDFQGFGLVTSTGFHGIDKWARLGFSGVEGVEKIRNLFGFRRA